MPLTDPPAAAAALADVPAVALAGRQLHRVWRYELSDGTHPGLGSSVPS